jgi:hypothetical protein
LPGCPALPCAAADEPLLLYSCSYKGLIFHRSPYTYNMVRALLEERLTRYVLGI